MQKDKKYFDTLNCSSKSSLIYEEIQEVKQNIKNMLNTLEDLSSMLYNHPDFKDIFQK
jgi:hypothetical protein